MEVFSIRTVCLEPLHGLSVADGDSMDPQLHHLMGFSTAFSNGDSLGKYLQAVRLGLRICGLPHLPSETVVAGVLRGARKHKVAVDRPALRTPQVLKLIRAAVDSGDMELARLLAIARHFLLRAADELFPLQRAGRSSLPSDSLAWHSELDLGKTSVIVLRTRKNKPRGSKISRSCVCRTQHPLLCGACILRVLSQDSIRQRKGPQERLFTSSPTSALTRLRSLALDLGLPVHFGWHSLRRGMARDLLDGGCSLGQLLYAGGWRSAAVLRYLTWPDVDSRVATDLVINESDSD